MIMQVNQKFSVNANYEFKICKNFKLKQHVFENHIFLLRIVKYDFLNTLAVSNNKETVIVPNL